jgi:hypothetical protein
MVVRQVEQMRRVVDKNGGMTRTVTDNSLCRSPMCPPDGWSELAPTNAPVEDEPVQPVLRMNILPARCVFFFT